MSLSSPGIGSGLDVNGIVDQLVALERRPITILQSAKTRLDTQLSSYGLMQSYMANLQSIANKLAGNANWARNTATSGDDATVGVSASSTAVAARYSVEVTRLATTQSLSSAVFADPSDLGGGTLTITRGGAPVDIAIDPGDASLETVRNKINEAGAGVSAAIVQDATGPLLVLTGTDSGLANGVTITVSGATGSLAGLAYPGDLTQRRAADDAAFTINGVPLTSASNRLANVIDGVDLTLKKTTTGPVEIDVASDTEALKKDLADFVAAYNELNRFLAAQTKYDEGTKVAGALQGDRTAVGLIGKLRTLVQQPSTASTAFERLSDLGLSLQRDGSLKIDDAKVTAALADPAAVGQAFSTADTGFAQRFKALADGMLGVDGALSSRADGLRASIRRNEQDQERIEDRVERVRLRLLRQYTALDNTVNQLTGLNNLVTQQLTALANLNKAQSR